MVKTNDALEILGKLSQDDPDLQEMVQVASVNAEVAQLIYAARTQAGLTQQDLADLINTQQPVIARLEDADYEGHSLSMLQRIAQALNRRVEIALVPLENDSAMLTQTIN
ncbi:helix-turn-helix domain-containing protein [Acaryochloris marina NIES-2412]|uniref:helix-turn-helix domain-containing protein n=1 Tax=Acaryochloris marina TaxID=155978 RepID=UPI0040590156